MPPACCWQLWHEASRYDSVRSGRSVHCSVSESSFRSCLMRHRHWRQGGRRPRAIQPRARARPRERGCRPVRGVSRAGSPSWPSRRLRRWHSCPTAHRAARRRGRRPRDWRESRIPVRIPFRPCVHLRTKTYSGPCLCSGWASHRQVRSTESPALSSRRRRPDIWARAASSRCRTGASGHSRSTRSLWR